MTSDASTGRLRRVTTGALALAVAVSSASVAALPADEAARALAGQLVVTLQLPEW
jgi:hypothetical protein